MSPSSPCHQRVVSSVRAPRIQSRPNRNARPQILHIRNAIRDAIPWIIAAAWKSARRNVSSKGIVLPAFEGTDEDAESAQQAVGGKFLREVGSVSQSTTTYMR